ncbi:MAG: OmpH family outer membrane protein, partial [Verrucomicrobiota bacterium]
HSTLMTARTLTRLSYLALALFCLSSPVSAQSLKIGIVDMKRVFADYHKTKEAEEDINKSKAKAKRELDDQTAKYKQLLEQFQELAKAATNEALAPDLRKAKEAEANKKGQEAKSLERQISEFRARRERQLQEAVLRMRKGILEEIRQLVDDVSKKDGYDLVFDKSGLSMNQVPILLHSKDGVDFSDQILKILNKGS